MKNINKVLSIVLVLSIALSMGCVGEAVPQYKTVEHSEPIYEYTHISIEFKGYYIEGRQTGERVEYFDSNVVEYSSEAWEEGIHGLTSMHQSVDDGISCNIIQAGNDKLIITYDGQFYEPDVYQHMVITVARHKEITGYNTWTEEVRIN